MTIINDVNSQKFSFNGVEYFKNFMPYVVGTKIRILNVYDSGIELTDFPTLYSDFEVDGNTFLNVGDLQTALLPILYTRDTLGGGGGSVAWGDITGTLSSQADLQSSLDAKQDTLVSGTNIKTINGSSLLGSGNLQTSLVFCGITNLSSSSYTGTTSETYLGNVMLPANTLNTSTFYNLEILSNIALDTLSGTIRLYLGTSAGALTDLIMTLQGTSGQRFLNTIRTSGTINNTTFEIVNGAWSSQFDFTNTNQLMQTNTINLTNDLYFNISFQSNDAGANVSPKFLHVKIYKNG